MENPMTEIIDGIFEKFGKNRRSNYKKCIPLIVEDPYLAYAFITNFIYPSKKSNGLIHESAKIDNDAFIGSNVQINENVIIKHL